MLEPFQLSPDAAGLLKSILDTRAYDRMPILADALEEAGFTQEDALLALREPTMGVLWRECGWCEGAGVAPYRPGETCYQCDGKKYDLNPHLEDLCRGLTSVDESRLRWYAIDMNTYDLKSYDFDRQQSVQHADGKDRAYQRLVDGLKEKEIYAHGTDLHGLYELPDPDTLADLVESVLGERPDFSQFSFTCSC